MATDATISTSTSTSNNTHATDLSPETLFSQALATLPKNKPLVFTNLLRFHDQAQFPDPLPDFFTTRTDTMTETFVPKPCTGAEAYWTMYFPIYHQATFETLGAEANTLQRVLYKGSPLMPLKPPASASASGGPEAVVDPRYWHAVVMTRVENWDVVERISKHELYTTRGAVFRAAAVADEALWVGCPVDGFEMMSLK